MSKKNETATSHTTLILLIVIVFAICVNLPAIEKSEKEGAASPPEKDKITLEDISWLAGHWQGEGFGGVCEEIWNKSFGPSMVGTFALIVNDEIKFYEIMIITLDSTGPVLKLKHFNTDLIGWEEKDKVITFPFVRASDNRIEFDGLVYEKTSSEELRITVSMKQSDGTISQEVIDCRLIKD